MLPTEITSEIDRLDVGRKEDMAALQQQMDKIERAQESASKEAEELKGKVSEEASQVGAKVEALQKNQEDLHAKLEEILGALGARSQPEPEP